MPPELMQLLQGGGGDPAAAAGPAPAPAGDPIAALLAGGGAPPEGEPTAPSIVEGQPGGGEDAIIQAIDLIQSAIDAEADQEDISIMLQCQANLQKILAKNQSEADSMMQGKASPRGLRRATAGVGAEAGY